MSGKFWFFQRPQRDAKVAQQDITELCDLAAGLLAFERKYLDTHGQRTPAFRLLSMITAAIRENIDIIEHELVDGTLVKRREQPKDDEIPF